ncbi:hypothetical protein [Inconstantimicrobium porci]
MGLKTCAKIIEMHNGTLSTDKSDDLFTIEITLKVKSEFQVS